MPACPAPGYQWISSVISDGGGGAYVVWIADLPPNFDDDVFAQHLTATGSVASGWPVNGLPVCAAANPQENAELMLADDGGVVITWDDNRRGGTNEDVFGLRLTPEGAIAPGWSVDGTLLVANQYRPALAPDGNGGFFLGTAVTDSAHYPYPTQFWAWNFRQSGALTPDWPAVGVPVCTAAEDRDVLKAVADGLGGVLFSWEDYRATQSCIEIYASRVLANGTLAAGWTPDGVRLSDVASPGCEYEPRIVPDGTGGAYVTWYGEQGNSRVQHLTDQGQVWPGWARYGERLATTAEQFAPCIAADGQGGAIVAWVESDYPTRSNAFARKFGPGGVVGALVSLASATAEPSVVRLVWQGSGATSLALTLERRSEAMAGWLPMASLTADGSERVSYEDRDVTAGTRYGYRLRWREDDGEHFTAETWVDVPAALELALQGLRPNPAVRDLNVAFVLPSAAPARLELMDVSGRQRMTRDLDDLSPGPHTVHLGDVTAIEPGVYWLRLTQGDEHRLARAVVMR